MNVVTLIGRLTRDPEIRHTASGDPIANMRLAVNQRARQADGSWGDAPGFYDVTVFGRQAGTVEEYVTKGRRVGVTGRLAWREWEAKDGSKRQAVEVVAQDVFFLDSRGDDSPTPAARGASVPTRVDDSDLPFAPSVA